MMKLLQAFIILMIIATVSVLFLLTHPSVTTLPIRVIQRHHFQFPGTHRTDKSRPLSSSSVIAKQHLDSENHFESIGQIPGREVAGPSIPRWRFPLTPSGSANAAQEHKETFVKAHKTPALPHIPLSQQLQRRPGLQPVYSQRDVATPQPLRGLNNNMLQRNVTEESYLEKKLPFQYWFQFPQPHAVRHREIVIQTQWVYNLRLILSTMKSKQVSLVTSNAQYMDILLNWLISATVRSGMPLESIIVISLDEMLHKMLTRKAILSVFLPPFSLLSPDAYFSAPFERVMMIRLAVMRIINHLGFDVANYDTDAIILRNPQPLYSNLSHYDIIGSVGKIPDKLVREWGITICIGVVLLRASRRTEAYWNAMNTICKESFDDQEKLNCGLKALDIKWSNNDSSYQNTTVKGIMKNQLTVSILPYNDICRQVTCYPGMRSRYYIWHKGGFRHRRDKIRYAQDGRTWFLKYEWKSITNNYIGVKWLQSIAYYVVTHT